MMLFARKYRILLLSQLAAIALLYLFPDMAKQAWENSFRFARDILMVFPPVLLLLRLLDSWAPINAAETYLGRNSGAKGMFLALILGSIAAGPLFAAFPIAATFSSKGARVANTVIFLGAWATIKLPMLMMESEFIGLKFSLLRLVVTVPFIFLTGILVDALLECPGGAGKRLRQRLLKR